jgi:hypothetical protein
VVSATNGRVQTQDVEGTVEVVNATGLKLSGAWVNLSRFHPVTLPETGDHVRLTIDAKGYIVTLDKLSSPRPASSVGRRAVYSAWASHLTEDWPSVALLAARSAPDGTT